MYKDYDYRERGRDREYRERGDRDRGDYRDLDRDIGRERERDIDRERYKMREDKERYRSSRDRERIRDIDRERNRNRDINKDSDLIRGKNNDDDYIGRKMRDEDLYRYKERDEYRKSLSRGYSRRRSRSRGEGQRMRRERGGDRRRNSYSRKSNSRHSHRNEIIDQTIKDGIRQIEEAESFDRTVLMYSFPNEVNEKKIFNFFATNDVLPVIDIKLLRDPRTNRSKNCCYVEFDTKDRAKQAINLSGQLLCGQPCQIVSSQAEKNRQALAFRLKKEKDKEKNPGGLMNNIVKYSTSNEQIDLNDAPMKIYVGGLTENLANITEDDLCNIFGFGDIDSIELHKDPITGRSKGYAFIQFHRASKAKEVIQAMNGFIYQGKALKVGEANENNTVIKGKMYVAQQQQQQQLQQQQLQQQMQMMKQQQLNQQGQEIKENVPQQEIN
jgi:RNA-binding protein 39